MSRPSAASQSAASEQIPTAEVSADPFDGVTFETPVLQHAKRLLAPFVTHHGCGADCGCGLREAIQELTRIDGIGRRYGSFEP